METPEVGSAIGSPIGSPKEAGDSVSNSSPPDESRSTEKEAETVTDSGEVVMDTHPAEEAVTPVVSKANGDSSEAALPPPNADSFPPSPGSPGGAPSPFQGLRELKSLLPSLLEDDWSLHYQGDD